jgi:glycosyltransferase involved in cell wall biosynthesis
MAKIAVFTYYGLDKGGTEKFLQTVAALLPKNKYVVDYYYIDSIPSKVSDVKKQYLIKNNVNLFPYHCDKVESKKRYVYERNTNFFDVFQGADLILTGSSGFTEQILEHIKNIPIVQTIHYVEGADNQYNISRVLHISEFSKNMWIKKGGDKNRTLMISHPIIIPQYNMIDVRNKLGISESDFVFGLHQRDNDYIYSEIPLNAYAKVENDHTAFVLCGGSYKYREQAKRLGLRKAYFLDATDSNDIIYSFLESIDVYTHGRFDGELNSTAIAEAMYFGLPVITHPSSVFNGQLEIIDGNGFIANDCDEYAEKMRLLLNNKEVYATCSEASKVMFLKKYDSSEQMKIITDIFEDVLKNPYPDKIRRRYLSVINSVYVCVKKLAGLF